MIKFVLDANAAHLQRYVCDHVLSSLVGDASQQFGQVLLSSTSVYDYMPALSVLTSLDLRL
jgi:hypothetical protein